jgi:hypothetical protein
MFKSIAPKETLAEGCAVTELWRFVVLPHNIQFIL